MTDEPPIRVLMLRRAKLGGCMYRPGQIVNVSGAGRVRCAWGLCATAQAKPADAASATMIELFGLERLAVPTP